MKSIRSTARLWSESEIRDLLARAKAKGFDLDGDELLSTTLADLEALVAWVQ
jgi:hypothetical protein